MPAGSPSTTPSGTATPSTPATSTPDAPDGDPGDRTPTARGAVASPPT
ncbi:hypothetical protein [Deinococcus soli (ex Cha et al. 2016)]|nr:hypothetical protein [Deinococcus soli (ex Cha et al. 2016)]